MTAPHPLALLAQAIEDRHARQLSGLTFDDLCELLDPAALRAQAAAEAERSVDVEVLPDWDGPGRHWFRVLRYNFPISTGEIDELDAQERESTLPPGLWRIPVANTGHTNMNGYQWLEYQFDAALAQAQGGEG